MRHDQFGQPAPADKRRYIEQGIEAEDRALAINPEYVDALVYKNILLRLKALGEPDRAKVAALLKEADRIRDRAIELQKKKASGTGN